METNIVPGQGATGRKEKEGSLNESAQTWPLRRVGLRVQDIAASVDYYTRFGLSIVRDERDQQGGGSVGLGIGSQEIFSLRALPGGHPRPPRTAGLYHSALLRKAQPFDSFSPGLRLGHMHLNVGNLERSMAFYQTLGMDLMVGLAGQADFLSWDGYHHHLGINLWNGHNARPVEPGAFGIDFYEIRRAGLQPATLQDPDGVTVIVS